MQFAKQKQNDTREVLYFDGNFRRYWQRLTLEAFKNLENMKIVVFYPQNGVSDIQELQMTTQEGNNCYVFAVEGNFDDAQTTVKAIFANEELERDLAERNIVLSSANSINWGRLLPQIVCVSYLFGLASKRKVRRGRIL